MRIISSNFNIRIFDGKPEDDFEQWLAEFETKTSTISNEDYKIKLFKAYMGSRARECMEGLNEENADNFDKLA